MKYTVQEKYDYNKNKKAGNLRIVAFLTGTF